MAVNSVLHFQVTFQGDGTSTSAIVALTLPTILIQPGSYSTGVVFVPGFNHPAPKKIMNLTSTDGQVVTGVISGGNVVFTWPTPIGSGSQVTVSGDFLF
jgi:hypothetical protein